MEFLDLIKTIFIGVGVLFVVGTIVTIIALTRPEKSKPFAILLAFLFGPIAHFYTGHAGKGIGLILLSLVTGGLLYFFVWLYSLFSVSGEINTYRQDKLIRSASVARARRTLEEDQAIRTADAESPSASAC